MRTAGPGRCWPGTGWSASTPASPTWGWRSRPRPRCRPSRTGRGWPCRVPGGAFGRQGEEGRRMLRVLSFVQHHPKDHPWAHPVDGLVAYVDLIERRVLYLIDAGVLPIPEEEGNFDDPAAVGPARTSLRPIQITQPEGPSFTLDGDEVAWEGWRLRVGFDAREGPPLPQLSLGAPA